MNTKAIEFGNIRLVTSIERGCGYSYSVQFINGPLEGLSMGLSEREYIKVLENLVSGMDDVTTNCGNA